MTIKLDPTKEISEDPGRWYMHAACYRQTFKVLTEYNKKDPRRNAVLLPAPFILGISMELYMKTFLLLKEMKLKEVISFGHNLHELRNACTQYDDQFENKNLKFITDDIGPLIMDWGGMRYPQDQGVVPIYQPLMSEALDLLDKIVRPLITDEHN